MDCHRGTETPRRKLEQRWHPHPGCLRKSGKQRTYATKSAQEWQAKDLQRGIFALWCNGRVPEGVCHPGCFAKRVRKLLKTKRRESEKERQESLRVRKRKELKEIEEIKGKNPAGFVRDNTRNGTIDSVRLSIVK